MQNINYKNNLIFLLAPVIIFIVSASVIMGWYTHNVTLVQVFPMFAPMQYNTALCFALLSVALILSIILQDMFTSACFGAGTLLISGLTLFQYIVNIDIGLDQLFIEPFTTVKTSHPGRMAPNTAICFALSALALILNYNTSILQDKKLSYVVFVLIFSVIILSSIALLGYLFKLSDTYGWGRLTGMAVHTSTNFIIWGIGYLFWFKEKYNNFFDSKRLMFALTAFTVTISIFLIFSQLIAKNEYNNLIKEKFIHEEHLTKTFNEAVASKVMAVTRLLKHWEWQQSKKIWQKEAQNYLDDFDSIITIKLLDQDLNSLITVSENSEKFNIIDKSHIVRTANSTSIMLFTDILSNGHKGLWIISPALKNGKVINYIGVLLSYDKILKKIISHSVKDNYYIKLFNDEYEVFSNYPKKNISIDDQIGYSDKTHIKLYNQNYYIKLIPTEIFIYKYKSIIPGATLVLGVFIALLVFFLFGSLMTLSNTSKQLKLLFMCNKSISSNKSFDEAILACITHICQITGWNIGYAYRVDKNTNKLNPTNLWFVDNGNSKYKEFIDFTTQTVFDYGIGLPGRILESGDSGWISDINTDDNFPKAKMCQKTNLKSAFGFPIKYKNKVILVLEFFKKEKVKYDQDLMNTIKILSEHLSDCYAEKISENLLIRKSKALEEMNKEIKKIAYKDPLTNLSNRRAFEEEATRIFSYSKRHKIKTAILYTDLDNFKEINDKLGHSAGDIILHTVAQRIKEIIRAEDIVARFGGDEFVILITYFNNEDEIKAISTKIIKNISEPINIEGINVSINISLGIKICSLHDSLADSLKEADKALYKAKQQGKARFLFAC